MDELADLTKNRVTTHNSHYLVDLKNKKLTHEETDTIWDLVSIVKCVPGSPATFNLLDLLGEEVVLVTLTTTSVETIEKV